MGGAEFKTFLSRIVWQDQFLHGFSYGADHLIIALMLGSGAIANDNRANALLVAFPSHARSSITSSGSGWQQEKAALAAACVPKTTSCRW